jgi:TonB family protein
MDDVPFLGVEYVPGRTLDAIFAARSAGAVLPIEHALLIAEKVLLALEAAQAFEALTGAPHGFLVPAFVNISNDGETRVFGGGLGAGLLPALRSPRARLAFSHYIAPEVLESHKPTAAADVYSTAVLLYEALTGRLPLGPDPLTAATLAIDGTPLPEDVKKLLRRGLHTDAGRRERSVTAYRKELGNLLYGGPYSPSTFNLAFFMQRHFEKAIREEKKELAAEEQMDASRLEAAPVPVEASGSRHAPVEASGPRAVESSGPRRASGDAGPARRPGPDTSGSRTPPGLRPPERPVRTGTTHLVAGPPKGPRLGGVPLWVAAAAVLVLGAGGFFLVQWRERSAAPAPTPPPAPTPAPPTPVPTPAPVVVGKEDPLFQAAVQARMQEETKRRGQKAARDQETAVRKRQADLDRTADETRKARDSEESAGLARERADHEEAARLAREARDARQRVETAPPEEGVPKLKEGDLVDADTLDRAPNLLKQVKPEPTLLALRRRISGTVLVRVLVDETGHAQTVEVIRDTTPKVGLAEACQIALKQWIWTPPVKDGKKVKTWIPVQVPFRLN